MKDIHPCPWFMLVYGLDISRDGVVLPVGTEVEFFNSDWTIRVGRVVLGSWAAGNTMRYCPIYGTDKTVEGVTGMREFERVNVVVGGVPVVSRLDYVTDREVQLGAFVTPHRYDLDRDGVVSMSDIRTYYRWLTEGLVPPGHKEMVGDISTVQAMVDAYLGVRP